MSVLKLKKPVILAALCALIVSFFAPTLSSADTISKEQSKDGLIAKADPYVYLDDKSKTFKISDEGKTVLTEAELVSVEDIINDSNAQVAEYSEDLQVKGDKFVAKSDPNEFQVMAINKKKNFDWEFTWWGLKVYWSHKFVEKLKDNIVLYGAGTAALNATIAYFASPPGWVTSFVAAVAGVGVWAFIKQDKGCGVYLDCYLYVPTRWYSAC